MMIPAVMMVPVVLMIPVVLIAPPIRSNRFWGSIRHHR
jgi:hypothetical protein